MSEQYTPTRGQQIISGFSDEDLTDELRRPLTEGIARTAWEQMVVNEALARLLERSEPVESGPVPPCPLSNTGDLVT